jgi:hypothetical protein
MKIGNTVNAIGRASFDAKVMYVGCRIPTAIIRAKALGLSVPTKMQQGYLLVKGDKPGLLVHPVKWDGKDVYQRGNMLGSVSALNATKNKEFKAEVVSLQALLAKAVKYNRVVQCRHLLDGNIKQVALLNDNGELYVAGIERTGTTYTVWNMEPPASYNDKKVRFTDFKDLKVNIRTFLKV